MTTKEKIKNSIKKVAETHFYIRPILVNSLKNQYMTQLGRDLSHGANTGYELWTKNFNDHFFDMGTLVRLATEIEVGLRNYYMDRKGYQNLTVLYADPSFKQNIFQKILLRQKNGVLSLFKKEVNYDLQNNTMLTSMQELMVCRHLYAHNLGILDDKFIKNYEKITGVDVSQLPNIKSIYPQEDIYYFEPLKKLNQFIENSKNFIEQLP